MFASIFDTVVVKPIFNLLVFITALIPGHNLGLAIIVFTIIVRLLMWPMIKKQLHHTKAMRAMQPEIKRIKAAAKGDRQKEQLMLMELYKERQISPFGSIGLLVIQFIVLIGLYQGLKQVINNPDNLLTHSYSWLHNLSWLKAMAADISQFDKTLVGIIDLTKSATQAGGGFYIPALLLVIGSAITQFYSSKQLMPDDKKARKLRHLLRAAGDGQSADQTEIQAAINRNMRFLIPGMILLFTISIPSALSLYWMTSGLVAYLQQARVLKEDETEMEAIADKPTNKAVIEGEVIAKKSAKPKGKKRNKRR